MAQPFKQRKKIALPSLNGEFPDHTWTFWASPSMPVLMQIAKPFNLVGKTDRTDEEVQEAEDAYFTAVAEIVLDTGESAIDLSTPGHVRAAFSDTSLDTELLTGIVNTYINRLLEEREMALKKAGERSTVIGV